VIGLFERYEKRREADDYGPQPRSLRAFSFRNSKSAFRNGSVFGADHAGESDVASRNQVSRRLTDPNAASYFAREPLRLRDG
jgi:hypothetical protein